MYIRSLLNALSADKSNEATGAVQQLALDPAMATYIDNIKHTLTNQRARHREMTLQATQLDGNDCYAFRRSACQRCRFASSCY